MSYTQQVSLSRCSPELSDAQVVERTIENIAALRDYGQGFAGAQSVAIKINAGVHRLVTAHDKLIELTDPAVVEGTVRAVRAVTDAEIIIGDAPTDGEAEKLYQQLGLTQRLAKIPGVRVLDFSACEVVEVEMPHSASMFRSYMMPREVVEADAHVSVAKMKAHVSMGFTLCMKNLFGWMPMSVYGSPRMYLHDRLIRLPRVICDLARWMQPCLNVVDGMVAASKREWGGDVLYPGVLFSGTNILATDIVGARVMGFDPMSEYPQMPFLYRRNPLNIMAGTEMGSWLGADYLENIEVLGPAIEEVMTPFEVEPHGGGVAHRAQQLRRGADCVARYQEQQARLAEQYHGRLLALFDGEVLWDGPDMNTMQCLEYESGRGWQNAPQFVVQCLHPHEEVENFEWYEVDALPARPIHHTAYANGSSPRV